jgi:hypothetical protein
LEICAHYYKFMNRDLEFPIKNVFLTCCCSIHSLVPYSLFPLYTDTKQQKELDFLLERVNFRLGQLIRFIRVNAPPPSSHFCLSSSERAASSFSQRFKWKCFYGVHQCQMSNDLQRLINLHFGPKNTGTVFYARIICCFIETN